MSDKNKNKNRGENANSDAESNETNSTPTAETNEVVNSHLADRIAGKVDEQGNKIEAEDNKD